MKQKEYPTRARTVSPGGAARKRPKPDERSADACRRVQQFCFYLLCGAVLLDILIEFNLHVFSGNAAGARALFLAVGWKALLLVAVFYLNLFLLARRGVLFGVTDRDLSAFPRRSCARIAAIVALALSVGLWVPRLFFFGSADAAAWGIAVIFGFFLAVTFALVFGVVFGSFYLAFRQARRAYLENTAGE